MQPHFAILLPLGLLPSLLPGYTSHFPSSTTFGVRTAPGVAVEGPCLSVNPLSFSPPRNRARPLLQGAAFAVFYCKIWVGLFMEGIFSLQAPLMTLLQRIIRHATLLSSYGLALSSLADCQSGVRLWLSTLASRLESE